ncbi:MAG: DUF3047 domain-containing protein [Cognaticolwellia sp.]
MLRSIIITFSLMVCLPASAAQNLTSLSDNGVENWEAKIFSGESIYSVGEYKGRMALKALSDKSASGLVLKQQVDLSITPYINWSWLIEKQLLNLNELSKAGDDFVARIYVVIDGGFLVWKTKSLSYVWSSNQAKGMVWDNPFTGSSVKMMSIQGSNSQKGKWFEEKRNLYKDLIDVFGDQGSESANLKAYKNIDIIAIMTDTDNSKQTAESYYGDILFTAL